MSEDRDQVLRECLLASNGDVAAAIAATEILVSGRGAALSLMEAEARPVEERREPWVNEYGVALDSKGVPLSLGANDRIGYDWVDKYGVSRKVEVPASAAEQRQIDRYRQSSLLRELDAALEEGRGVRLAIEDELKKQRTASLYGAGTVGPIGTATTEVGRLAPRYGESEGAGHRGAGAGDTAKVQGGKQRAKAKRRASKRRKSLLALK